MPRYVFREDDPRLATLNNYKSLNAQKTGDAIAKLKDRSSSGVLEAAASPNFPAHHNFEWDDKVAGHKFRLEQARVLCQVIRIASKEEDGPTTPAFVSIQTDDGRRYYTKREIVRSADLQLLMLKQAERDLDAFRIRYAELQDVCTIVSTAKDVVVRKRRGLEGGDRPSA